MDIISSSGFGATYGPVCQGLTDKSELFQAKWLDKPVQTDNVSVCRRDEHLYPGGFYIHSKQDPQLQHPQQHPMFYIHNQCLTASTSTAALHLHPVVLSIYKSVGQ